MSEESATARTQRLVAERRASKDRVFTERTDKILSEEDRRRAADAAKTAKLRQLRLAKEAADREAAKPNTGSARRMRKG